MSQIYSTVNRDMAAGRVYSTQRLAGSAPPAPRPNALPVSPRAQAPAAPLKRFAFQLGSTGLPGANRFPGAGGSVLLEGRPGEAYRVEAQLWGVSPAPDPAIQPALWLLHDLTVPVSLDAADLAALPKGPSGTGNQPGTVFTFDGTPPTYGPPSNTLSVAVTPGRFTLVGGNAWRLQASLEPGRNRSFHPLFFAGPEAMADMNASIPSGTMANILSDLFLRPATVHPELPLRSHYLARLKAVTTRHLALGQSLLDGSGFTRTAVSLEGLVRPIPQLMPTRDACILLGANREES